MAHIDYRIPAEDELPGIVLEKAGVGGANHTDTNHTSGAERNVPAGRERASWFCGHLATLRRKSVLR